MSQLFSSHCNVPLLYKSSNLHCANAVNNYWKYSNLTADIRHVAGKDNLVADALSRAPGQLSSSPPKVEEDGSAGACPSSLHHHWLWPASFQSSLSYTGGVINLPFIAADYSDQPSSPDTMALLSKTGIT